MLNVLSRIALQLCCIATLTSAVDEASAQDVKRNKFRAILAMPTQYEGNFNSLPGLIKARPHLESALRSLALRGGFKESDIEIRVYTDVQSQVNAQPATEPAIVRALLQNTKESIPGDVLVFFFSGHGQHDEARGSFLYTSQGDPQVPTNRINLRHQVIEQIARSKASVNLVLIDACQEPTAMGSSRPLLSSGDLQSGPRAQGVITLLSATPPELAWIDSRLGYGFFTAAVIDSLQGGASTAKRLVADVAQQVPKAVRKSHPSREQNPMYLPLLQGGEHYSLTPANQPDSVRTAKDADPKITVRLQSPYPAKDIFADYFFDFVKALESSRLKVEVLPAGATVPSSMVLDAVAAGTLSAGTLVSSKQPPRKNGATFIRCGTDRWLAWNTAAFNALEDAARAKIYEVCLDVQ